MPLPIPVHLDQQLGGVGRGRGVCVQQDVLVLRQVLGGRLLGSPGAVQQLSLQQREVGLENKYGKLGRLRAGVSSRFALHINPQSNNTYSLWPRLSILQALVPALSDLPVFSQDLRMT